MSFKTVELSRFRVTSPEHFVVLLIRHTGIVVRDRQMLGVHRWRGCDGVDRRPEAAGGKGELFLALSPPFSVRHHFCRSPIWQVPEGLICHCCSPDKGSSITYICSFFPCILCIDTTVILCFLRLRRCRRKHVQLILIKMRTLAAGVTAFTVETRPGDLRVARHSVTRTFMPNAVIFGGKRHGNYSRKKTVCTKRRGAHSPPCLPLPLTLTAEMRFSVGVLRCPVQSSPSPRAPFSLPSLQHPPQSERGPLVSSCSWGTLSITSGAF